ncbi:MAG TPA: alpha/beta hydrolase [Verrucomicrobiae bacterium]|nr:alpha/beta hydrolase [Verrucomicrobiae bacterium]
MIRWFEHRQVYAPSPNLEAKVVDLGRPAEDLFFSSLDGNRLHGWWFPADAHCRRRHLVLLLLHGNLGNVSHRLPYYRAWLELGVNVFAFDYRGFGCSEGTPSEAGTYLDAQAAVAWLGKKGFAPSQIVALGKSLGGGIGSELALREPLAGLILQSTFTSIPDVGEELFPWLPVRRWHSIKYATVEKLPRITMPVLIAHCRKDDVVRFHHAQRNFQAANDPKMFLEIGGGHNNVIAEGRAEYLQGLDRFLRRFIDR